MRVVVSWAMRASIAEAMRAGVVEGLGLDASGSRRVGG